MKKLLITALALLTSCAANQSFKINDFNAHLFSADMSFIRQSLACESTFLTDKFNTTDNEVFRCNADNNNLFLTIESDGNNSETLQKVTLIWKRWYSNENQQISYKLASQFAAVFAKIYAKDRQLEFVDAFLAGKQTKLHNVSYEINTSLEPNQYYNTHKAILIFK